MSSYWNQKTYKMKPLVGVITDTHMKVDNIELVKSIFKQFIDMLIYHKLKKAVHMGDWFTSRASQTLECLLASDEILDMFEEAEITLYIFAGNHDKVSLVDETSYLSVICRRRHFVMLFEKETSVTLNGIKLHFLPYFKEGIEYLSRLSNLHNSIDENSKNLLFTHTSVNGVRNNDGSIVDGDVDQDFFELFDLVVTGHYHDFSEVGEKVIYLRSAYQANFGEDDNKGFSIINTDLSIKYIQSNFPIYKKLYVDIKDTDAVKEILETYTDSKDNIRVVLRGDQEQIENMDVNKFTVSGISTQFDNVVDRGVLFEEVEDAEVMTFDKKTVIKNFMAYTKHQEYTKQQSQEGFKLLQSIQF